MRAEIQSQSFISSLPVKLYQAKTKVIQEFRKIKDIELKEISNKIFTYKSHYIVYASFKQKHSYRLGAYKILFIPLQG